MLFPLHRPAPPFAAVVDRFLTAAADASEDRARRETRDSEIRNSEIRDSENSWTC